MCVSLNEEHAQSPHKRIITSSNGPSQPQKTNKPPTSPKVLTSVDSTTPLLRRKLGD